jgi:hypothetical protein
MKHILTLTFLSIFGLTFAQTPSYVPSNGLVGWWPFNSNANDESGNGNNGTVNGATLTLDRNGVANCAYGFDGVNDNIIVTNNSLFSFLLNNDYSINIWMNSSSLTGTQSIIGQGDGDGQFQNRFWRIYTNGGQLIGHIRGNNSDPYDTKNIYTPFNANSWLMLTLVRDYENELKMFVDGALVDTDVDITSLADPFTTNRDIFIGSFLNAAINQQVQFFNGSLDDIGIWNRALTEAEILALYEGCQLAITTQPQYQSVVTSVGTASFAAASSSTNATYQWQSNLGLGFQNLSNAGQYSGAASSILTVSNLSMSNNNQVFRCVVNDGGCVDTTSEAILTIIDDASLQSNTQTSFKLYPNPVKDELFIKGMPEAVLPFEVYSTDGKKVLSGTTSGAIDVNALKKGTYQLKIKEQMIPFVKQ